MPKTAFGLFENPMLVDEVVHDLLISGFQQNDVRILGEPREMAGSGVMSTPHTDFEVGLTRDLTALVSVLPNEKSREIAQLQVKASHRQAKEFRDLAEKIKEK